MRKLKTLFFALMGEVVKLVCRMGILRPRHGVNQTERREQKVVVSLTSYGRRVNDVVHFTIISLLRQTYKPDEIVLWLDHDHWNDQNLPKSLQKLKQYGLTVRYCKDTKSYKKLIPALQVYPDSLIITCDDDIYYRSKMVERLMLAYEQDPTRIYTHRAHQVSFDRLGHLLPYNDWKEEISATSSRVFPTGGGGCLYSLQLLHEDISKEDLYMSLAPKADDVWFYFMELLKGTSRYALPYKGFIYIPLDVFYQFLHKYSNLSNTNCKESQNDVQIRNVMNHYGLTDRDLME